MREIGALWDLAVDVLENRRFLSGVWAVWRLERDLRDEDVFDGDWLLTLRRLSLMLMRDSKHGED